MAFPSDRGNFSGEASPDRGDRRIDRALLALPGPDPLAIATFGTGCFWHGEAAFAELPGVVATAVGYMGGPFENPSYLDVLARITGHAEVTQLRYDPAIVAYAALLDAFWDMHDPTQLNRQGPDRGEQYRSVIFCHGPEQETAARTARHRLQQSGRYANPIVTQIQPASAFWRAADEHQQYFARRRTAASD